MRSPRLAILAVLMAQRAMAIVVEDCEVQVGEGSLDCALTNDGEVAVAELDYELLVTEDGRTVPWGKGEGRVAVYGGIEPGETVEFTFPVEGLPISARGRTLVWEFTKLNARDVDGRRIRPNEASDTTDATPPEEEADEDLADAGPALDAEPEPEAASGSLDLAALVTAIQGCWNAGVLSAEAQAIPVTVGFELDGTGRLLDEVRLLSGDSASDSVVDEAFGAASRAIVSCQGDGYAAPAGNAEGWGWAVLTFDPVAGELRYGAGGRDRIGWLDASRTDGAFPMIRLIGGSKGVRAGLWQGACACRIPSEQRLCPQGEIKRKGPSPHRAKHAAGPKPRRHCRRRGEESGGLRLASGGRGPDHKGRHKAGQHRDRRIAEMAERPFRQRLSSDQAEE